MDKSSTAKDSSQSNPDRPTAGVTVPPSTYRFGAGHNPFVQRDKNGKMIMNSGAPARRLRMLPPGAIRAPRNTSRDAAGSIGQANSEHTKEASNGRTRDVDAKGTASPGPTTPSKPQGQPSKSKSKPPVETLVGYPRVSLDSLPIYDRNFTNHTIDLHQTHPAERQLDWLVYIRPTQSIPRWHGDKQDLTAAFIQTRGKYALTKCTNCEAKKGLWLKCIERLEPVRTKSACGNCEQSGLWCSNELAPLNADSSTADPSLTNSTANKTSKKTPVWLAKSKMTLSGKTPAQKAHKERASATKTSKEKALAQETPTEKASAQKTSNKKTPAQTTPGEKTSGQRAPARKTPTKKISEEKAPAQETSKKKASVQKTPEDKISAQEAPKKKAPAQKKKPKEKTPGQKTAEEKAPVQDAPNRDRRNPVRETRRSQASQVSQIPTKPSKTRKPATPTVAVTPSFPAPSALDEISRTQPRPQVPFPKPTPTSPKPDFRKPGLHRWYDQMAKKSMKQNIRKVVIKATPSKNETASVDRAPAGLASGHNTTISPAGLEGRKRKLTSLEQDVREAGESSGWPKRQKTKSGEQFEGEEL
ncbi:hypothetical protein BDW74DRAFT_180087 [Aspergillus multicolor]|uniref:uncharacterized protein n=1 Tax=Aspergillus multicolor TaxID=41759 RepID=UPI003CCDAADA